MILSRHKLAIAAGTFGVGVVVLWWLYRRERANALALVPAAGASASGGMYYPATTTSDPDQGLTVNLAFQDPSSYFSNQATGYVPLFGFIGVGRTWG